MEDTQNKLKSIVDKFIEARNELISLVGDKESADGLLDGLLKQQRSAVRTANETSVGKILAGESVPSVPETPRELTTTDILAGKK